MEGGPGGLAEDRAARRSPERCGPRTWPCPGPVRRRKATTGRTDQLGVRRENAEEGRAERRSAAQPKDDGRRLDVAYLWQSGLQGSGPGEEQAAVGWQRSRLPSRWAGGLPRARRPGEESSKEASGGRCALRTPPRWRSALPRHARPMSSGPTGRPSEANPTGIASAARRPPSPPRNRSAGCWL